MFVFSRKIFNCEYVLFFTKSQKPKHYSIRCQFTSSKKNVKISDCPAYLNLCEHIKKSSAKAPEPQLWLYFARCLQKAYSSWNFNFFSIMELKDNIFAPDILYSRILFFVLKNIVRKAEYTKSRDTRSQLSSQVKFLRQRCTSIWPTS